MIANAAGAFSLGMEQLWRQAARAGRSAMGFRRLEPAGRILEPAPDWPRFWTCPGGSIPFGLPGPAIRSPIVHFGRLSPLALQSKQP